MCFTKTVRQVRRKSATSRPHVSSAFFWNDVRPHLGTQNVMTGQNVSLFFLIFPYLYIVHAVMLKGRLQSSCANVQAALLLPDSHPLQAHSILFRCQSYKERREDSASSFNAPFFLLSLRMTACLYNSEALYLEFSGY